jgi:hypothetical protein
MFKFWLYTYAYCLLSKYIVFTELTVYIFVAQSVEYQELRPLYLVLKTMLRQKGLASASTGGLSSYALILMVVAHFMVCGAPLGIFIVHD